MPRPLSRLSRALRMLFAAGLPVGRCGTDRVYAGVAQHCHHGSGVQPLHTNCALALASTMSVALEDNMARHLALCLVVAMLAARPAGAQLVRCTPDSPERRGLPGCTIVADKRLPSPPTT